MSSSVVPPVGERIREERLQRGMTLRALARAVGVSASLVSQIETGKSRPSVSTLYAITQALGISVEDVFDARDPGGAAPVPDVRASQPTAGVGEAEPQRRIGPLVRSGRREILELDSGVTWQRLGRLPGTHADFLLVTYAPGGCSSSSGQLMRHSGVEYGYVIEGELVLSLGFDEHRLAAGDAVSFASTTPHRYRNDTARPAVGVWFVYEPDEV